MNKSELKTTIQEDLYRYTKSTSLRSFLYALLTLPGFTYMYFLRKTNYFRLQKCFFRYAFFRLILNHYRFKFGFDIPFATSIGPGFYIGHFGTVIINAKTQIGKNVNVAPGVTIGQVNRGKRMGTPVIGNSVWIGANAVIVGNISIGDDVLIAPGAYVNDDVPAHSVVMGNPSKIVSSNGTNGYIANIL